MDAKRTTRGRCKYQEIHILVKMCRRRGRGTAISLYDPLPSKPPPKAPVYKNIVAIAVRIQVYLAEDPQRTYTDAGAHFGVTRSRVSQLMTLLEKLPDEFITMLKTTEDQSLLKRFSGKSLLRITGLSSLEQRQAHITTIRNRMP